MTPTKRKSASHGQRTPLFQLRYRFNSGTFLFTYCFTSRVYTNEWVGGILLTLSFTTESAQKGASMLCTRFWILVKRNDRNNLPETNMKNNALWLIEAWVVLAPIPIHCLHPHRKHKVSTYNSAGILSVLFALYDILPKCLKVHTRHLRVKTHLWTIL